MGAVTLGLDLGTSGVRVVAVNVDRDRSQSTRVVAQATRSYPLLTPHPGWTEQNPSEWVTATVEALAEVAQAITEHDIIALGLSGQMHGMVALDAAGTVIRPTILWNDQRTGEAVAEIEAQIPRKELIQRTGNPAITGFQLPKVVWLRTVEPDAFAQTQHILLPKDYLGYVLTGEIVTEPSDASGIGCLNLETRQWDADILTALNLNPGLFPTVIGSTEIVGHLSEAIAAQVGLPVGLPVVAGGGDNAAAAIGLGISHVKPDRGSLSIGTSGVIFVPLKEPTPEPEGRVHLFCHVDGAYHLLGVTLAAAGSLRWYHDTVTPNVDYSDLMTLANQSPAGARGVLFLPHLAGERTPYLDPNARGAWVGLSLAHQQPDLIRAVLEGVAYSLRAALEVMTAIPSDHGAVQEFIATGGGAKSKLWLQILSDVLGVKLIAPDAEEGAAYGAALLAAIGSGVYSDFEDALTVMVSDYQGAIEPQLNPIYDAAFKRYDAVYSALKTV